MKNKLFLFLRIFISFSLIAALFWMMRGKLVNIAGIIKGVDPFSLLIAFLIFNLAVVVMGIRLRKIFAVQELGLSVKESVCLCYLGYFFNNFLPTAIGGDLVKAYYAGKKSNKKAEGFSAVVMDRILAMLPFTLLPMCALIFMHGKIINPVVVYLVAGLFLFALLILAVFLNKRLAYPFKVLLSPIRTKKIYKKITKMYQMLNIYRHHKIVLVWNFVLSLISQGCFIVSIYFIARSVGVYSLHVGVFFLLIPIIGVISMAPSISGHGVREAATVYMFKDYMPDDTAFALSLLAFAMLLSISLIGGLIYAFMKNIYSFKPEIEGEII